MNDHQTTLLSDRLHRLADHMTPQLDVVDQVRNARAQHRRKRRGRIALLAVATATTAVVVGSTTAIDLLSVDRSGEVADPAPTTAATPEPAPTTASAPTTVPVVPSTPVAPTTAAVPSAPALPDGEHFVFVHAFDPATAVMDLQPAQWLGEGRSWSCAPDRLITDITEHCVGDRGTRLTIEVAASQFVLTLEGDPPYPVGAEEFAREVDELVDSPVLGSLIGWATVQGGKVVEFQQTPWQSA